MLPNKKKVTSLTRASISVKKTRRGKASQLDGFYLEKVTGTETKYCE